MHTNSLFDPKEKSLNEENTNQQQQEEGVYLVNDDGTDFDTSERTYITVDLPEEEKDSDNG